MPVCLLLWIFVDCDIELDPSIDFRYGFVQYNFNKFPLVLGLRHLLFTSRSCLMSEREDPSVQPVSEITDLEADRAFLLDTHKVWKRTQHTVATNSSLPDDKRVEESAVPSPHDFFQVDRREADFRHQDLRNANFQEAYLPGADFEGADLRGANFHGANLRGARFYRSQLAWANFSQSDLIWADFQQAELTGTLFQQATLRGATFLQAQARGTNFSSADCSWSDFGEADLSESDFQQTNLSGATFLQARTSTASFHECQGLHDEGSAQVPPSSNNPLFS